MIIEIKKAEILSRYTSAIPTINASQIVQVFNPLLVSKASQIAIKIIHSGHKDLMDCWIAASAVVLDGILLTEDIELSKIMLTIPETKKTSVWTWKVLQQKI